MSLDHTCITSNHWHSPSHNSSLFPSSVTISLTSFFHRSSFWVGDYCNQIKLVIRTEDPPWIPQQRISRWKEETMLEVKSNCLWQTHLFHLFTRPLLTAFPLHPFATGTVGRQLTWNILLINFTPLLPVISLFYHCKQIPHILHVHALPIYVSAVMPLKHIFQVDATLRFSWLSKNWMMSENKACYYEVNRSMC